MSDAPYFSRRQMILGSAVAGAAAASAGTAAAQAAPSDAPAEDHRTVALKDTPHTRAYYALARS